MEWRGKEETMMKDRRLHASLLLLIFSLAVLGCYTIKVSGKATLAPSSEVGEKVACQKHWYVLWGLVPIGDNSTDSYIPPTAKKVRVETKMTFWDGVINIFAGFVSIQVWTAEVYEIK